MKNISKYHKQYFNLLPPAWLAWLLLPQAWGGLAKGVAVFGGAVVLSWILTMALRRLPLLGRIL